MKVTTAGALAQAVRDQRKVNKLTQSETAEQVGIKQTTVSDLRTNLNPPSWKPYSKFSRRWIWNFTW